MHNMDGSSFEKLFQAILYKVIGNGVKPFGEGPDGGREATFDGPAEYSSKENKWNGRWLFQAKFHRPHSVLEARKKVFDDINNEFIKLKKRIENDVEKKYNNYILGTNVPFSSVNSRDRKGTHEKIEKLIFTYKEIIENVHYWDYTKICNYLNNFEDIRDKFFPSQSLKQINLQHHHENILNIAHNWHNISIRGGFSWKRRIFI